MSDTNVPADVLVLRPRKVSVSKKLDGFLDKAGLMPAGKTTSDDNTRPSLGSKNAMICADCGQVEYLTREYCRCGHYLGGQLQDEYLAWEQQIHTAHAELSEDVQRKLKPLRVYYLLAIPFMLAPAILMIFWLESFALNTLLWWMPAMLIAGAGVFAEAHFIRPLKESAWLVENYSFQTFIDRRRE